jgi:hypothetical protein
MALRLQSVPPARGLLWVRKGLTEFMRHPLGYSGLYFGFMMLALVLLLLLLPWLGSVLLLMALPLLSLAFMLAAVASQRGHAPNLAAFLAPWRTPDKTRRRSLAVLCITFGACMLLAFWIGHLVDGGALVNLVELLSRGTASEAEVAAQMAQPGLMAGLVWRAAGAMLVSAPFWHAPALVFWVGQKPAQALFSSALAVWRSAGAMLVYLASWAGLSLLAGLLSSALLVGSPGAFAQVLLFALSLMLQCAFYVSLYFCFRDCFGEPD